MTGEFADSSIDELATLLHSGETIEKPVLYKRRFFQLFCYFVLLFMFGFAQNAFPPIQDVTKQVFDISVVQANFFAMVIIICNIPFSLISGFTLNRLGLRKTLFFLCGLPILLSGWLRYILCSNYYLLLLGQTVGALGSPFALACSALLSEKWFAENERALATAVGGLAPIIGSVGSSVVGPMFFTTGAERDQNAADLKKFIFTIAILDTVAFLLTATITDEPPTPPSISAAEEKAHKHDKQLTLAETIATPIKNIYFLMLMASFAFGYGSINAVTTLINQILKPIGYEDSEIGTIGAGLGLGVLGALGAGVILDRTKAYLKILKFCSLASAISFCGFILVAFLDPSPTHAWLLFATLGGVGLFGVPLIPLLVEMGVETLFPLSEGVATGFLWLAANTGGLTIVLVATFLQAPCENEIILGVEKCVLPPTAMFHAVLFLGSCFGLAVIMGLLFNGPMLRFEYEKRQHTALHAAHSLHQPVY